MKSTLIKCVLWLLAIVVAIYTAKLILDFVLENVSYLLVFSLGYVACVMHTQYLDNK